MITKNRLQAWLGLSLSIVLLLTLGSCSNSDGNSIAANVLGGSRGSDPGFVLAADPTDVVIDTTDPNTPVDPATGKFLAKVDLLLTALDDQEVPQEGLEIFFSSALPLDSAGNAVLTDANGEARDTLLVLEDDPDLIDVTATDGTRMVTITLTKTVILPNQPPVADAGMDVNLECTAAAGTPVTLDGSGSSDPDSTEGTNDDIVLFEWFRDFGTPDEFKIGNGMILDGTLKLGTHAITLRVTDSAGETATDEIIVEIVDTTPPTLSLQMDPSVLWPPNHKMREILVTPTMEDACSDVTEMTVTLVSVSSNEPDNGIGDGNTTNDIQGVEAGSEDYSFLLRAERAGGGSGRIYSIVYNVVDDSENGSDVTAEVLVPHDMGD